jgi:hypothetical protein
MSKVVVRDENYPLTKFYVRWMSFNGHGAPGKGQLWHGFYKYQLLKLGGGSDYEGPNAVQSDDDWGADPVAAFEQSRRHDVKPEQPTACAPAIRVNL